MCIRDRTNVDITAGGTRISDDPPVYGGGYTPVDADGSATVLSLSETRATRQKGPLDAPTPGAKYQRISETRTQHNAVWVTGCKNVVVYQECTVCHTKIDDVTKECKRKGDKGCMSDPGEIKCLATVTIADSSGSCDNIGIEGECLLTFTKCETIDDLLKLSLIHI